MALYNEFYRLLGVEHQKAVTLPARAPRVIGIALNRRRPDFTERDRLCLDLLQPHLVQAYRNAAAVTELERELAVVAGGVDELGCGIILLDARCRVKLMTRGARRRLSAVFGEPALRNKRLPDQLEGWVREQERLPVRTGVPSPRKPLLLGRGATPLWVRLVTNSNQRLLLLEGEQENLQPPTLEGLGLTRREAEVLVWVSKGKTNAEIATILVTSIRTVEKHVERILEKLGVETRTAAARMAHKVVHSL